MAKKIRIMHWKMDWVLCSDLEGFISKRKIANVVWREVSRRYEAIDTEGDAQYGKTVPEPIIWEKMWEK